MRIPFDPASPGRLRRFGLGLPFDRPVAFTAEFALEPPLEVQGGIDTAMPCRIGAFTSIAGGRTVGGGTLTPDQVMRSTCGSLERIYRAQAG